MKIEYKPKKLINRKMRKNKKQLNILFLAT